MQVHSPGGLLCKENYIYAMSAMQLLQQKVVVPRALCCIICVKSVTYTNCCFVFWHPINLWNAIICYHNWTSWIVFNYLMSTSKITLEPVFGLGSKNQGKKQCRLLIAGLLKHTLITEDDPFKDERWDELYCPQGGNLTRANNSAAQSYSCNI